MEIPNDVCGYFFAIFSMVGLVFFFKVNRHFSAIFQLYLLGMKVWTAI